MSVTVNNDVKLTLDYADGNGHTYTFTAVADENLANIKTRVQQINQVLAGQTEGMSTDIINYGNGIKATFLSPTAKNVTADPQTYEQYATSRISQAKIITTRTTSIYG